MTKKLIPDSEEIKDILRAQGDHDTLAAFEKALASGDKIRAVKIIRKAGLA
jgi:hypothetical protein